ncbi:chemotaxis protein MotB [Sodalis ligni]|uniref:Chemotaxis protein MotB n=1 Tax=Sodalis ligni TaxID=2697027 RepID=A0A4R1N6S2_9GAMM|nr:flagellar motor protein MotB [Sodalis ligni]TCL02237.1 chemotaxis protein MotB [Sodalis ligni]
MKNQPVVVIRKRRSSPGQAQHGGAWKIAYADFMTAMMAFFLVMWLLSIASPQELTTIAEYFRTPLNVALTGGPRSSTDSSPIPGGGDDPTRQQGDVHKSLDNLMEKLEKKRLNHLRERLDQLIESDPRLRVLRPQLLINMVQEGLQIQILDSQNRPMFETGSALVEPYMRDVLRGIAPILNDIPNKISISGHTDAAPYANGERGYSNWELSADRANASRRELISGGLAEGKILRVVGMSSTMSIAPKQPYAAINRRISLVVLNKQTEEMIEHENVQNPAVEVNGSKELSAQPALKEAADARRGAPPATQANAPAPQVPPSVPADNAPAPQAQPSVPAANPPAPQAQPSVPAANPPAPQAQPSVPAANPPAPQAQPSVPAANPPAPQAQPSVPAANAPAPQAQPPAPAANPPAPQVQPTVPAANPPAAARARITTDIPPAPNAFPAAPAKRQSAPVPSASGARVNRLSGTLYGVRVHLPNEDITASPMALWSKGRDSAGVMS